jgi:hypothetical protein
VIQSTAHDAIVPVRLLATDLKLPFPRDDKGVSHPRPCRAQKRAQLLTSNTFMRKLDQFGKKQRHAIAFTPLSVQR